MTGLVILAAGESSRLGEPKQKKFFKGKSLLQRAVETGLQSKCSPVILILGAHFSEMQAEIQSEVETGKIITYENTNWEEGIASSIRSGIEALQETTPSVSGVIIMVSDQPFVDSDLLNEMINKQETTGKGIIACSYKNTLGVPVLFDKEFFPKLLSLKGQEGAKNIILKNEDSVAHIEFPLGSFDIDTIADYKALTKYEET